jgi:hypothetical protein
MRLTKYIPSIPSGTTTYTRRGSITCTHTNQTVKYWKVCPNGKRTCHECSEPHRAGKTRRRNLASEITNGLRLGYFDADSDDDYDSDHDYDSDEDY